MIFYFNKKRGGCPCFFVAFFMFFMCVMYSLYGRRGGVVVMCGGYFFCCVRVDVRFVFGSGLGLGRTL